MSHVEMMRHESVGRIPKGGKKKMKKKKLPVCLSRPPALRGTQAAAYKCVTKSLNKKD